MVLCISNAQAICSEDGSLSGACKIVALVGCARLGFGERANIQSAISGRTGFFTVPIQGVRRFTRCLTRPRSGPYPAGRARPWPGRDSASSFPGICDPSNVARCARRSRRGAFAWRTSSGISEDETARDRASRALRSPCTCRVRAIRDSRAARERRNGHSFSQDELSIAG